MKKITGSILVSAVIALSLTNCENKKTNNKEIENIQEMDETNNQAKDFEENKDLKNDLSYNSYIFAENLNSDNFFESDNVDKVIELKDVGITSYLVSGDEVTLGGIFYDKEKNIAIPRSNNNPPGRAFVPEYYDKLEMKYDEKYKTTYSASLSITLKDPKSVKKLKMYLASESLRNFEYRIDGGIEPEYRSGFIDVVNVKGIFKGLSAAGNYPNKIYAIENAEIN